MDRHLLSHTDGYRQNSREIGNFSRHSQVGRGTRRHGGQTRLKRTARKLVRKEQKQETQAILHEYKQAKENQDEESFLPFYAEQIDLNPIERDWDDLDDRLDSYHDYEEMQEREDFYREHLYNDHDWERDRYEEELRKQVEWEETLLREFVKKVLDRLDEVELAYNLTASVGETVLFTHTFTSAKARNEWVKKHTNALIGIKLTVNQNPMNPE